MTSDEIFLDVEKRMEKAIGVLKHALAGIRTGRANPGLVDSLRVDAYGSQVPMKQLASVGAPEPNQIVIRPYDPGTIKDIEKAIQISDLGFNAKRRPRDSPECAAIIDRCPPQDGGPHQGFDRRGRDCRSQRSSRRKQHGRPGGEG